MITKAVSVYGVHVDPQGKVLLIQDSHSSLWGFPGGGIEGCETHEEALCRELLEETGMKMQGNPVYVTCQEDGAKQRYFYKINGAEGHLRKEGNGVDVEKAAYFDKLNLPVDDLAFGVEAIMQECIIRA